MSDPLDDRLKARITGAMLGIAGAVMVGYLGFAGPMPPKAMLALSIMGPLCLWVGLGLVVVPVSESVFERLEQGADLGGWYNDLPRFWKFWAPLSLVVLIASMLGAALLLP